MKNYIGIDVSKSTIDLYMERKIINFRIVKLSGVIVWNYIYHFLLTR